MEPTVLQRIFSLASSTATKDNPNLRAAGSVIRQLVAVDRNDTKAAGAIATLIGELPVETQALVVAAIESIAAIAVPATAPA
jgi:hypothetical protein